MTLFEQTTLCENVIIREGELNSMPDWLIDIALEWLDKAGRNGLKPLEAVADIVDLMHDAHSGEID